MNWQNIIRKEESFVTEKSIIDFLPVCIKTLKVTYGLPPVNKLNEDEILWDVLPSAGVFLKKIWDVKPESSFV